MIIQGELAQSFQINRDKVAIENGTEHIKYSTLDNRSNRVRNYLLSLNLSKETVIGVQLEDKVDIITSVIGILKAGCTFVLVDALLPQKRRDLMVSELELEHMIVSVDSGYSLNSHDFQSIISAEAPFENNLPDYDQDDSIYVYFTSGSTGKPKGIVGKNCSLVQYVQWQIQEFDIDSTFRVSQLISPYFDAFLRDIFVPLLSGATICIPPSNKEFFEPKTIASWIDSNAITLIHCVPSVFRTINNEFITSDHFSNLKYVLLSGERIIPAELTKWYELFDNKVQLVNMYGATETTMVRSFYKIKPEDVKKQRISIGTPIADTEFLIANKDFKPCNKLVAGDLYIVTDYTTKGYLNMPELNAERFITINAGTAEEKSAFKTGDKARLMPDGTIDLLGREDRQVKLRGIRIELDEIENIITTSDEVQNAIVVVNGDNESADQTLVAFFKANESVSDTKALITSLEQSLKESLPEYMLPTNLVAVEEFPLLQSGKINQKELLSLLEVKNITAPVNDTEERLLNIWKGILGDKPISTEDSFHSIGGNSLTIMKLIGRIYKEFDVKLSLSQLFANLTIVKQAEAIGSMTKDDEFAIKQAPNKPSYNLSASQERLYYEYELNKQSTAYNLPMAWNINIDYDRKQINKVVNGLIERHESLRTEFKIIGGKLQQIIKDPFKYEIEEITIDDNDLTGAIHQFVRPFDFSQAPLIRCGVITAANGKRVLVMDIHHIVCDGESQVMLFNEFYSLYKEEKLAPLAITPKDYSEWEYNLKSTKKYLADREFWLRKFEGDIPSLGLPLLDKGQSELTGEGEVASFSIDKKDLKAIEEFLASNEVTAPSVFLSIYYLFLSKLTGQESVVIGITSAGRMHSELEKVIGMFVKTLPILLDNDWNTSFTQLVKEIHQYSMEAIGRQTYDLSNIVSDLNKNNNSQIGPLFETTFSFLNFSKINENQEAGSFSAHYLDQGTAKFPLMLLAAEGEETFGFRFEYSKDYFHKSDIETLITQFKQITELICQNLNVTLLDIAGGDQQEELFSEDEIAFDF